MASPKHKSKKPSAQNLPPPEAVLFIDRNAGRKLAQVLKDSGYTVHHHDDHFKANELDENWLRVVGGKGWIVITLDDRIRYRPLEKLAVQQYGVRMIIPAASGNMRGDEIAALMLKWLPKALRLITKHTPPIIVKIRRDGGLQIVPL